MLQARYSRDLVAFVQSDLSGKPKGCTWRVLFLLFFRSHFQFFFHLSFRFTLGVSVSSYFRFFVGFTLRFSFLGFSFLLIIILLMAAVSTMALQVLRLPYTLPVDAAQVTKDIEVLHAAGTAQAGTDEVRLCVFRMSCLFFWLCIAGLGFRSILRAYTHIYSLC